MKLILRSVVLLAVFEVLWLMFVFNTTGMELIAGFVGSTAAFISVLVSVRSIPLPFQPRVRWILQAWRLPGMILGDIVVLLKCLFRRPRSSFEATPLRTPANESEACAQRGIAITLLSTSPNTIVVHIDRDSQQMLIHKLEAQPPSKLLETLQGL
jgi:multisubunit Na+/H+ antiporter MnhE subunit